MKIAIFTAIALLAVPGLAHAACQQRAVSYNEPSQRLDQAVQRMAHSSGCFVDVDLVRYGRQRTAALKGSFLPREALARLVYPLGLSVQPDTQSSGYKLVPKTSATTHRPALSGSTGTSPAEARIDRQAATIDHRIDAAVTAGTLPPAKAAELHLQVGRVLTDAGHAGRTQATLSTGQTAAFETTLTRIDATVPRR